MNIFLGGAHRTGKTSVAKKVAQLIEYNYVPTELGKMDLWSKIGSPSAHYSFGERVGIQTEMFVYFLNKINEHHETNNIFDRSLFDLMGYLNTNYDSSCSAVFDDVVCNVFTASMNQYYAENEDTLTFILQPNPDYKYIILEEGKNNKVYNSYAYRQALTDSIIGYAYRNLPGEQYIVVPEGLNIDETVEFIISFYIP